MNLFKRFFPLSILVLGVACSSADKPADQNIITDQAKARLDSTLKALVDSGRIAGVSALIFEKNKEVYFNSFGYADREANKAMDRNTCVRIYSMTKPVTGVALMKLYEQGLFQLDDPISKYAPEFADMKVVSGADANGNPVLVAANRPITIRDLTRHTAGFANANHPVVGKLVSEANVMNPNNTLAQMATKLATLPLAFHPGKEWSYGICVDVQAYLVERISGKPFEQFVRENITGPLAMNSTKYVPEDMSLLAAMYARQEDGSLNRVADSLANSFNGKEWPLKPGGYGLTSNIDDYMRFARMLVNEGTLENTTILKPETVKLMATNHLADSVTERMWLPSKGQVGFGIDFAVRVKPPVDEKEHAGIVGEFFWDGAASTLFWVDPQNELTAVLFVQIFPFDNSVHNAFRRAVYGPFKNPN
ncbi:MAG: beta-lactamase family protein [Cyclobacteriaceae bacterium]|nr:beta-lactamase family protein [Cyclobacteriaceae bacterium]